MNGLGALWLLAAAAGQAPEATQVGKSVHLIPLRFDARTVDTDTARTVENILRDAALRRLPGRVVSEADTRLDLETARGAEPRLATAATTEEFVNLLPPLFSGRDMVVPTLSKKNGPTPNAPGVLHLHIALYDGRTRLVIGQSEDDVPLDRAKQPQRVTAILDQVLFSVEQTGFLEFRCSREKGAALLEGTEVLKCPGVVRVMGVPTGPHVVTVTEGTKLLAQDTIDVLKGRITKVKIVPGDNALETDPHTEQPPGEQGVAEIPFPRKAPGPGDDNGGPHGPGGKPAGGAVPMGPVLIGVGAGLIVAGLPALVIAAGTALISGALTAGWPRAKSGALYPLPFETAAWQVQLRVLGVGAFIPVAALVALIGVGLAASGLVAAIVGVLLTS